MRVRSGSRLFDLDYSPSESHFYVDELAPDAGFNTGYRFNFGDFPSAKVKLMELLELANGEGAVAAREASAVKSRPKD